MDTTEPARSSTDGAGPLPIADELSRAQFAVADFDCDDFLSARRHTPLDELRSDLRGFLTGLRTELVGTINDDVDECVPRPRIHAECRSYIGLAIGLRLADKRLERVARPVEAVREDVVDVRTQLEAMQTAIEAKLAERAAVRRQKATLRLMLSIDESVLKVEALLLIGPDVAASPTKRMPRPSEDRTAVSATKRIERVASEFIQMRYLVAKGVGLPFVDALQPRIAKTQATLQRDLATALAETLHQAGSRSVPDQRQALLECFRTYHAIGKVHEAEEVFRREVVRPWAATNIRRDALTGPLSPMAQPTPLALQHSFAPASLPRSGSSRGLDRSAELPAPIRYIFEPITGRAADPLTDLYNKILAFVVRDCALVLEVTEHRLAHLGSDATDGRGAYDVLVNVIFDELTSRLTSELGHVIFAAGRPDLFHASYTTSADFLSRLEAFCSSPRQVAVLRASPAWIAWQRRWQLPVYFQLRFKELVSTLESSLTASDGLGVRNPAGSAFVLPATTAVDQAIGDCWRSDIYLPALAPRFWRLTLQLLGRYRSWLDDVLPRQSSAPSKTSTSALSRAGTPQPDGAHADDALLLRQLSVIVIDTTRLCASVLERFDGTIAALLPRGDADASEPDPTPAARSALLAMTASLESILPPLLAQIVGVLSRQSAEPLRSGLRSVTSEVRAGGAAAPTEPSHFVGRVLKPLRSFLDGAGRDMPTSSREQIAADVLDDMAGRYASQLDQMRQAQDSLRRLKKGRQGFSLWSSASRSGGEDEEAHVRRQVQIDVDAFCADAKALGVPMDGAKGFRALRAAAEADATA